MAGGKGRMSGTGWHFEKSYYIHPKKENEIDKRFKLELSRDQIKEMKKQAKIKRKTICQPSTKKINSFVLKNFCSSKGKLDIEKFMCYMNKNLGAFSGDSNKQTREIIINLLKEQAKILNKQIPRERIEKKNITYIIDRLSF